jgi:hypothetical protein
LSSLRKGGQAGIHCSLPLSQFADFDIEAVEVRVPAPT